MAGRIGKPTGPSQAEPEDVSAPCAGDLRVWWIPQVPMKAFERDVTGLEAASILLDTLAAYDAFQFENKIKPDYCNAGGLVEFDGAEWCDWNSAWGEDFDEVRDDPELLAQAIEARRAATENTDAVHESAVAKPCAQYTAQKETP